MTTIAEIVAIAHGTASAVDTSRIRKTSLIAVEKIYKWFRQNAVKMDKSNENIAKRKIYLVQPGRHIPPMHFWLAKQSVVPVQVDGG